MKLIDHLKRPHGLAALALLVVIAALSVAYWPAPEEELYIAFFGRIRDSPYAGIHRHSMNNYLRLLSDEIPGYRFVLKPYYLDDDSARPGGGLTPLQRLYSTVVARDERYVLVIDNTWAKHVEAVDSIVRESKIPMLSLNADKGHADFGEFGIFIGHADLTPKDLVTYMNEVLQPATVGFVGEKDYWLTDEFLALKSKPPKGSGRPVLTLDHEHLVGTEKTTNRERGALQEELETWFENAPQPAVLLLNVHNDWGIDIIQYVDDHLENVTILAAAYASREGKSGEFSGRNGNRLILMTEPEDAVSKRVSQDSARFRKRYPKDFEERFNHAFYVKRCLDATEIVRQAILHTASLGGERLVVNRKTFSSYFREQLVGKSVAGRYDLYSFDSEGRQIPEISFVEYRDGVAMSQWKQLNSHREIIPTVFFGIDLLDIGRLDPVNGRFRADFYYWVRTEQDIEPATEPGGFNDEGASSAVATEIAGKPVSDFIHFRNLSQLNSGTLIDGAEKGAYRLERISGEFNVDFQLEDYPLDTQELALELELANPFDNVRVAFDYAAFNQGRCNTEIFDIPGWKLVECYVTVDNIISRALRGASRGENREPKKYKTLTVRIVTQRKLQSALISVALPLCTIGFAALALLFLRDLRFNRVGDVYVGVFLSIITYSIAFGQITPATGVVTRADYLFYLTFLVVLLVFLRFVVLNVLGRVTRDDVPEPNPWRWILGYGAVTVYVAAVLAVAFL